MEPSIAASASASSVPSSVTSVLYVACGKCMSSTASLPSVNVSSAVHVTPSLPRLISPSKPNPQNCSSPSSGTSEETFIVKSSTGSPVNVSKLQYSDWPYSRFLTTFSSVYLKTYSFSPY